MLEDDGITSVVSAGFETAAGYQDPVIGFWAEEAGSYFLRVDETDDDAGDEDWACDIDIQVEPAGDPMLHDEVEPNDQTLAWQELGDFGPGVHRLSGVAATGGHDANNNLSGDLDVFWFVLEQDAFVELQLDWPTEDDLDAILYRGTPFQVSLGFGSGQAVSYGLATNGQPESTALALEAGTYVFEVGTWEGEPDVPWTAELRIISTDFELEEG